MRKHCVRFLVTCGTLAAVGLLFAPAGYAQTTTLAHDAAAARLLDKPHTQAELGVGMLTLPTSRVCLTDPGTCTKGDISPSGHLWMLYRASRRYAVGAGATYALPSGGDEPRQSLSGIARSHSRQYLLIDAVGRYYALRLEWLEGWGGVTMGGVVVKDQFQTEAQTTSAPILGPSGVTIRTEGVNLGIAAGVGWAFAPNWSLEASFRSAWWFLPSDKACAPTLDCATLAEDVAMFTLGVGIGYRIAL